MKYISIFFIGSLFILIFSCAKQTEQTSEVYTYSSPQKKDNNYNGSVVQITKEGNSFQLLKDGEPFHIKGGAGRDSLELLKKAGGNTVRIWVEDGLDTLLDKAHDLGLMVFAGLYFNREREGFDYNNQLMIHKQRVRILEVINQHKDHPALLAWAIGNEPELGASNNALWHEINWIAEEIKRVDPNHPVTAVLTPQAKSMENVARYCPALDFLSFNIFKDLKKLPFRVANSSLKNNRPYVVAEWSSTGYWEAEVADWSAPMELYIPYKKEIMEHGYQACMVEDKANCLGGFVFYWGQKQERTHTWFSLFMENGAKTALIDMMYKLWESGEPNNYAPIISTISLNNNDKDAPYLQTGQIVKVKVNALDRDNDPLTYVWEILSEGRYDGIIGGDFEERPKPILGLIKEDNGESITFKIPSYPGAYRVFCHVYDNKGGGGYINLPFFVMNNKLN